MKILAVCGFGVGSSMVLKMTIDKVAKEMGIQANVENTDLSTAKATQADVYFTSQELLNDLSSSVKNPVYPVKKYMDKEEVKMQLEKFLEERGN
ncbi:PTS system ascorbate-specific IIB component [Vagococcus fluvialis]|uniref:PTS ascorbate transporter subunit IIB n=1 Tax=Vagococcus fluvialis TaxID=2738 RepID=A0A369B172_9ENTE|nr:PTS sugar transporter subunit IIB [Vagococcus fluvialis]NKC59081.1 PTS sugar transporter subunit IIB [Vagococcus fluvialis]NKD49837.1 PTS sugar transporter subunit IIB [Vagococcus fluvialis]RCX15161.1 PTS system ascorbate-specific IIB component [Vagococcus fluvialis]RSU05560.1 PTS ascorbate transporter subunit IIB [Vagococcus fluvialis]